MKMIQVRLGESEHMEFKMRCIREGGSMSSKVVSMIVGGVREVKPKAIVVSPKRATDKVVAEEGYMAGKVCGCGARIGDDDAHYTCVKCRKVGE